MEEGPEPDYKLTKGGGQGKTSLVLHMEPEPDPRLRAEHASWIEARTVLLKRIFARDERVANVDDAQKSHCFLRDTCLVLKARDIEPDAKPLVMLDRLAKRSVTHALATATVLEPPTSYFARRIVAPVYSHGSLGLLGLAHQVIQIIFGHCCTVDLFRFLYICKYLQPDARAVLERKAWKEFDNKAATPLALSILTKAQAMHVYPEEYSKMMAALQWHNYGDTRHVLTSIRKAIEKHGSMEGYIAELRRQRQLALHQLSEADMIARTGLERFAECRALLARHGEFPVLFVYGQKPDDSYKFVYRRYTHLGEILRHVDKHWDSALTRMRSYICKASVTSLAGVERDVSALSSPLLIRLLAAVATGMDGEQVKRAVYHVIGSLTAMLLAANGTLCGDAISDRDVAAMVYTMVHSRFSGSSKPVCILWEPTTRQTRFTAYDTTVAGLKNCEGSPQLHVHDRAAFDKQPTQWPAAGFSGVAFAKRTIKK